MNGNGLAAVDIHCPYCGETLELSVDTSAGDQDYIEDCQVCCQPIHLIVTLDATGVPSVQAMREDDVY
jgi:hypothetical protein